MKSRLQFLAALLLIGWFSETSAQSVRAYAGEFLQMGVGARSLGLGGAAVAISTDVTAGYWNPAGLTALDYPSVGGMHESRFDNTVQYNYGAVALPLGPTSTLGLTALQISIDNIKDTRSAWVDLNRDGQFNGEDYIDYSKVTSFGNHDWAFLVSYAKKADSTFSYGANVKLILRKLDEDNSATGLGVDLGVRYQALERLVLGAVLNDATTTLISFTSGEKELIAPTLKVGAAYSWFLTQDGYHRIIPTLDLDLRFESLGVVAPIHLGPISANYHIGAEYEFGQLFAVRLGYNDMQQISAGAGIHLPKLSLDYTFLSFSREDQLGNVHRISFAFTLEQAKLKRPD